MTRVEAENLIDNYCDWYPPPAGAIDRVLCHDWNKRDRESIHDVRIAVGVYAHQDEVDEVIYG